MANGTRKKRKADWGKDGKIGWRKMPPHSRKQKHPRKAS